MSAEHTKLTPRGFAGFSVTMFCLGLLAVGFGAIDLAMVARLGAKHVAAVGVGESVVTLFSAFAVGFVDSFTVRLAKAEGAGETGRKLPVLGGGFLLALVPLQLLALGVAIGIHPGRSRSSCRSRAPTSASGCSAWCSTSPSPP
jgi:Na+-driven multidrug efflux pump